MFQVDGNILDEIEKIIVDYIPDLKAFTSQSSTTVYGCDSCTGCNPCTGVV